MLARYCNKIQPFSSLHTRPPVSIQRLRLPIHRVRFVQSGTPRLGPRYQGFPGNPRASLFQRWAARPTFYYEVGGLGLTGGAYYVYNLEEVPVSGRRRFNIVNAADEEAIARQMYQQTLQAYRGSILPAHDARVQRVRRVLERLIPSTGLTNTDWEVWVIESEEKNAFVMPGGKVFVFTGILPICGNDDGLATVMGHEIAHNLAHHQAERLSQTFVLQGLVWLLEMIGVAPASISYTIAQYAFERPGSRKQESEADYIGLMMMAQSCYDPGRAVEFWSRMEKAEQFEIPQFISTHPSHHNRQGKIREWLPEARQKQLNSDCSSTLSYAKDFHEKFKNPVW